MEIPLLEQYAARTRLLIEGQHASAITLADLTTEHHRRLIPSGTAIFGGLRCYGRARENNLVPCASPEDGPAPRIDEADYIPPAHIPLPNDEDDTVSLGAPSPMGLGDLV